VLEAVIVLTALAYLAGGLRLLILGGSSYYCIGGGILLAVAVLLWRGSENAARLYAVFMAATVAWALAESGLTGWALTPRLSFPASLGLWFAAPWVSRWLLPSPRTRVLLSGPRLSALVSLGGFLVILVAAVLPSRKPPDIFPTAVSHRLDASELVGVENGEWP
jgi:quinoprotein glucose dehydrogenase